MVLFNLYLVYDDDPTTRPIATGCTKKQLLYVLSRHLLLAQVDKFLILPIEENEPFKEYTL